MSAITGLLDMLPSVAAPDVADIVRTTAELGSYLSICANRCANCSDIFVCEFSIPAINAVRQSAFVASIVGIICGCSNSQVRRITTRRIVADMKNAQPFWNWPTVGEFPSHSVGLLFLLAAIYYSITVDISMGLPFPAIFRLALLDISRHSARNVGIAIFSCALAGAAFLVFSPSKKRYSAPETVSGCFSLSHN